VENVKNCFWGLVLFFYILGWVSEGLQFTKIFIEKHNFFKCVWGLDDSSSWTKPNLKYLKYLIPNTKTLNILKHLVLTKILITFVKIIKKQQQITITEL